MASRTLGGVASASRGPGERSMDHADRRRDVVVLLPPGFVYTSDVIRGFDVIEVPELRPG